MDAEAYRADARERWETAAAGWARDREGFQRDAMEVSRWMLDAADLQPGHTVLELAAGPGDTGLMAAELVKPGGKAIITDNADAMIEAARGRAEEVGATNVELRPMEAEWIDLPTATVDGVLCRWGYMLLADPEAALRETRRVLRSGGRVALAAWAAPEHNPWVTSTGAELVAQELTEPPDPDAPSMFSFAAPGHIEELLAGAGFTDVVVDAVDIVHRPASFDEWWEMQFDTSPSLGDAMAKATPEQRDAVYEGVQARLEPFRADDGSYALPGRTLVAVAEA